MPRDGDAPVFWWVAFVALSVGLVLPLWVVTYPPGVDLPQHGAQIAIGMHWSDPTLPYRDYYEYNALSQSILSHALVFLFATVLPIVTALKLTVSIAVLGIPVASLRLIRAVDGDRWWVFATMPIAYSFAFYWGFLDFIIAVPLGIVLVSVAVDHVRRPTRRTLMALGVMPLVVFLGHVLVLVFAGLASAAVVFFGLRGRDRLWTLLALMAALPLIGAWFIAVQLATPSTTSIPDVFWYGIGRFVDLPGHVVGMPTDLTYAALGLLAIASPFIAGARPSRFGWRWAPILVALLLYLAVPQNILGTALVYPRYAIFLVPALLVALQRGRGLGPGGHAGRGLIVAVGLVAVVASTLRFMAFEREASSFMTIADNVEPGSRVLGLTFGPMSDAIPYPVYLHWVCWLQVERQAVADFSFAEFFPNRFRYQADRDPNLPDHVEWAPGAFRWSKHSGIVYDYFLIRNGTRSLPNQFAGATTKFELVTSNKPWSLVRQRR